MESTQASAPRQFGPYLIDALASVEGPVQYHWARRQLDDGMEYPCLLRRFDLRISQDKETQMRLLDEARLVIGLHHPGIVSILDYGVIDGELFVEEERVGGTTLGNLLPWGGPLDPGVALLVIRQLAEVLAYVHEATDPLGNPMGLVHRSLTSQQIHITSHGEVRLSGFGMARFRGRVMRTSPGMARYQAGYASPEELDGNPVDHRCDLFGLGVLLFQMVTGQLPYPTEGGDEVRRRVREEDHADVAVLLPGVDPRLPAFIHRLLRAQPRHRPDSAEAVWRESWSLWRELGDPGDENKLRAGVDLISAAEEEAYRDSVGADEMLPLDVRMSEILKERNSVDG
jgi:eukaryotic-like serine/threonine-protein kinase